MLNIVGRKMLGALFVTVAMAMAGLSVSAENGWISGMVTDADMSLGYPTEGAPIHGARVSVVGGSQTATSDPVGYYNISVPVGRYNITVNRTGYNDESIPDITVFDNETTILDVILLRPTGNLTGRVLDEDGPAANAYVACGNINMVTGLDGIYTLTGLQAGTDPVNVTIGDNVYRFNVTIAAGVTTTRDFNVTTPSPLVVTVSDEDGNPVANALLIYANTNKYTDLSGRATFTGLRPGINDSLRIMKDRYVTYNQTQTLEKGGSYVRVTLELTREYAPPEKFIGGFEALPVLAVAGLAALVIGRKRRP